MITPVSTRKKPVCKTCNTPMAGHRRESGRPICPLTSNKDTDDAAKEPFSPPQSPSPLSRQGALADLSADDERSTSTQEVKHEILEAVLFPDGEWHWRNPNATFRSPYRPPARSQSHQSTVLCDDDGNTIGAESDAEKRCEEEEGVEDNDQRSTVFSRTTSEIFEDICDLTKPVVSVFSVDQENIAHVREYATRLGTYTGVFPNPYVRRVTTLSSAQATSNDAKRGAYWLVMGKDRDTVQYMVDLGTRRMPGSIGSIANMDKEFADAVKVDMTPPAWRWLKWFIQLVLAAAIGGLVVVGGLMAMLDN